MADDTRHARPDLSEAAETVTSMDFFELLRQLETDGMRFGRAGGPDREPARLGQGVRMAFAVSDVADMRVPDDSSATPKVDVNVIGLLGPEGPMPLHLTRWVMQRLSNRWFAGDGGRAASDTAFLDFCNMLQHRMMGAFWRSWADMRPEVQISHGEGGQVAAIVRALAGIGLPGTRTGPNRRSSAKMRHATSLALLPHGPDRLAGYLGTVAQAPVSLVEFIGVWTDLPEHLQSRLGQAGATLGRTAVVGARIFERQSRAELRIGPLRLADFLAFLDDPDRMGEFCHAVLYAMGHEMAFDLRLVLAEAEVPPPELGKARLGRTTWLRSGPGGGDAEDMCLTRFTTRGGAATEMAA